MAFKLSPELLLAKYIKSATNGRVISVRLRRILTLVIIPIWLLSFAIITLTYIEAFKAIPKYQTLKRLQAEYGYDGNDKNPYGGHVHTSWNNDGESVHQCGYFDGRFWEYMGILSADHRNSAVMLFSWAEKDQLSQLYGFWSFPILLLLFVVAPWLILRLVFWIKDAKEVEQVLKPK